MLPVSFVRGNGPGSPIRQSSLFVDGMENHAGHEFSALLSIPDIATVPSPWPVRAMDSVSINSPVNIKMKIAGLILHVVPCG
ncbi:hypothetical protein [Burkholderia gladioli]|uniref:hypothetical protein n=1 Tax=Burkholderia gladioli TaxID=28095 RepID=UPI0011B23686|nr:hypothetical protein [Burkholderia gladioli]MBA1361839.1 hypothetical protein [Burkholderia gladioli]MBU9641359.1 hypothetical protein [Burkholderia gladioli]MDJ1164492.1 hypothetical protein [Burkholderia gladioli pv. gladioli]